MSKLYDLYSFYICRYQGDRYAHSGTVYCHWECNSIDSVCTASKWDKYDVLADELAALVNYVKNLICADIYQALQDENDYVSDTEHIKEYFKECDFYDWYEDGTMYIEISKLPIRQITVKNKKILRYCLAVSFFLYFIPNLSSFANI